MFYKITIDKELSNQYFTDIDNINLLYNDGYFISEVLNTTDFNKIENVEKYELIEGVDFLFGEKYPLYSLDSIKKFSLTLNNTYFLGACRYGYLDIIKYLIEEHGFIDLNKGLINACLNGHLNIIKYLIDQGANNLNQGIMCASIINNIDSIKYLISAGANELNKPLVNACLKGYIKIVKYLILSGANDYNNAFLNACKGRHLNIIQLIIDLDEYENADIEYEKVLENIEIDDIDIIKLLIEKTFPIFKSKLAVFYKFYKDRNKKIIKYNDDSGWLKTCAKLNMDKDKFIIDETKTNGDCLFDSLSNIYNETFTIRYLRNLVAYTIIDETDIEGTAVLSTWKCLYDMAVKENDRQMISHYKHMKVVKDVSEKDVLLKENRTKVYFEMIKNTFWAEEYSLQVLEKKLNIKMILIHGNKKKIEIIPNKNDINYIVLLYFNNSHYQSISYNNDYIFDINHLPEDIMKLLKL